METVFKVKVSGVFILLFLMSGIYAAISAFGILMNALAANTIKVALIFILLCRLPLLLWTVHRTSPPGGVGESCFNILFRALLSLLLLP